MHRKTVTISIAAVMLIGCLVYMPSDSRAAIGYWCTNCPCPTDPWGYEWDEIYFAPTEPSYWDAPEVATVNDSSEVSLKSIYISTTVIASDFTDTGAWIDHWGTGYDVSWFPPATAEIETVYIVASFNESRGDVNPAMYLEYSVSGLAGPWEYTTFGSTSSYLKLWDVTNDRDWDNTTFLSSDFVVRLIAFTAGGGQGYYLDYLGIIVIWLAEGGSAVLPYQDEGSGPSTFNPDFSIIYSEEGFLLVLGMVGFLGMISVPPMAILMYRKSEGSKIHAFVMALTAFVFSFTLFMYWVTSSIA